MSTSKIRQDPKRRQGPSARSIRSRRPGGFLVALLAVVVGGAALGWLAASDDGPEGGVAGEAVESFTHLHGLDIAPWAPEDVYVSSHAGLIRVRDGQWRYVSEVPHDFMGFAVNPSEEQVMFSSGHPASGTDLPNPVGFMVSTDGGETWEPRALQGRVDFHAMAVQPLNGDVVYGWSQGLYASEDAGRTWEQIEAGQLEETGAMALAVAPDDAGEVWAGTERGLLRSRDGGRTWEPVLAGVPVTAVAFDPAGSDTLFAYATSEQGLLRSQDHGETWESLGLTLDGDAVSHLAVHPVESSVIYAGTMRADVLRSRDGGETWETLADEGTPQNV